MATLMAGHRKMEESKQVRDDPSTKQALKTHQGRAQGDDQAPLAAIARVSAEAVWCASPIPAAQPVALFARPAKEFSC